jgi:hypothetical protein
MLCRTEKKAGHFFLPAAPKLLVIITHHMQLPYPHPWENNPVKPLGRLNPPPATAKLKNINTKL